MLKELKFVMGAVGKRDLIPAMTHFRIEDGFVRSYNGIMALCSPIAFDINCTPNAAMLVKAIAKCEDTIVLGMTPNGRLRVQSGGFKAFIDCVDVESVHPTPKGVNIHFDGEAVMKAIKSLMPFVGDDASRPWTNGILLRDKSAFATNNVCLIEYWLGEAVPFVVNIPKHALVEILRIGEAPTHVQVDVNSITFHYPDGRWILTQLLSLDWMDMRKILDQPSAPLPIPEGLFTALDAIANFTDNNGRVYMAPGLLRTTLDEIDAGAVYEVPGLGIEGCYQIKMLSLLNGIATAADFSRYPAPTLFFGDRLRGAIIGMRV